MSAPGGRIAIVGGGFTGAALAIHLVRHARPSGAITVFEPRARLGAGLAYSTDDPDHRFNGPIDLLSLFPDDPAHFERWYHASGERAADPQAVAATGQLYCRRAAFARYMAAQLAAHGGPPSDTGAIVHDRRRVVDLERDGAALTLTTDDGTRSAFGQVFLCTSFEPPAIPGPLRPLADDPRFVVDPWAPGALDRVPREGDVLLVGTALTAVDVVATLMRRGQRGTVTAISRRGLLPRPQDVLPSMEARIAKFLRPTPLFVERHGVPHRLPAIVRAVRADIAEARRRGRPWQDAFDDLRDAGPVLWAALPVAERRRALRHLRAFYDAHRYRMAPQLAAIVEHAQRAGRLTFARARCVAAEATAAGLVVRLAEGRPAATAGARCFAAIVNCTGPTSEVAGSRNPLLAALVARGLAAPDPTGAGLGVDAACRPIAADGGTDPRLVAFGPLTRGRFGDLTAIPQINAQILRTLTGSALGRPGGAAPTNA
ncbi:FAD/NAD(P)-binding protein [Aquibium sp. A9E412]|uniref:FAD/NAD(P)-binding protein n=1 Tax=Aquibium sp. A9E412 TaxID=2976767 RepID=UPI0025B27FD5|nr:FAD/NAD(P)-binding protein [Aquibium sp. A9E412]MDN2566709.1 FAD/NAD(P)-binding protein [Aquibium sp. A9E412]